MLSLSVWTYIISYHLESKQTKKNITNAIKKSCLICEERYLNTYQVDNAKVWENIIMKDPDCKIRLQQLNINDVIELESYYYASDYRVAWRTHRTMYRKFKR